LSWIDCEFDKANITKANMIRAKNTVFKKFLMTFLPPY
jgi:hypothetical protein